MELSLLHAFGGLLFESSLRASTQDDQCPYSVVLNTLVWSNPACFPSKLNCSFNKHLLNAYRNPSCVRCWRHSSKSTIPASAHTGAESTGALHSSGTNYVTRLLLKLKSIPKKIKMHLDKIYFKACRGLERHFKIHFRQQQAHGMSVKPHRASTLKGTIPIICTSSHILLHQSHYLGVTLSAVVSVPTTVGTAASSSFLSVSRLVF